MQSTRYFATWLNHLFVFLQKKDWRGKYRLYVWLSKHFADKVITHNINNRPFCVPLGEWCFWLDKGPENYYLDEFVPFCEVLNGLHVPFTLFDLGADIGTVSSLVAVNCQNLKNIVAFEPNSHSYEVLTHNLEHLRQYTQCINAAVSDFGGFATFHADKNRLNDHEGYIDNNIESSGAEYTVVTSLDKWWISEIKQSALWVEKTIALKIDVEGQEIQVLHGARGLIECAEKVIILIEIHPHVLARTNNSPDDLFAAAENCRTFDWIVPLHQNTPINRKLSFFEQLPLGQYDVIGISK